MDRNDIKEKVITIIRKELGCADEEEIGEDSNLFCDLDIQIDEIDIVTGKINEETGILIKEDEIPETIGAIIEYIWEERINKCL